MRAEVRIIWDASEIAGWQWQILVEMYPKIRTCGSVRRKYEAKFDAAELARAQGNGVSAATANQFATAGKLASQNIAFLPEPHPANTSNDAPRAGRQ